MNSIWIIIAVAEITFQNQQKKTYLFQQHSLSNLSVKNKS
jgi:hypothetical protein